MEVKAAAVEVDSDLEVVTVSEPTDRFLYGCNFGVQCFRYGVALEASTEVVLMTLLSGMGTIWWPVVGATLVVSLQNYLATLGDLVTIVIGLIFVLCVSFFRRGVVGELFAYTRRDKITTMPKVPVVEPKDSHEMINIRTRSRKAS